MKMGAWSPLAVDRVRYVGDAVAILIADTKGQARDAAEAVEVEYNVRDAVTEAQDILKRDPNNLEAHKLLGRIYLRSLGDMQPGAQSLAGGGPVERPGELHDQARSVAGVGRRPGLDGDPEERPGQRPVRLQGRHHAAGAVLDVRSGTC